MTADTVLHGGLVFDGTGSEPTPLDIRIIDDRIVEVAPSIPGGDTRVDLSGTTVIPGLIDAHVHVVIDGMDASTRHSRPFSYQFYAAERNLGQLLACGITTVRDAGGADLGVKQAVEERLIHGPDVFIAVTVLSQTGGHADGWNVDGSCTPLLDRHPGRPASVVDGVDNMRARVREVIRAGADVIKLCTTGGVVSERDHPSHTQFTMDEVGAAVAEAHAAGLPVMAHAHGKQGILNAIAAGVRSIEHGIYADDECFSHMKANDVWLVPTLSAPYLLIRAIDEGLSVPAAVEEKCREVLRTHATMFRGAIRAGIKIAMGTDSGVFAHGLNLTELQLMSRAGMDPNLVLAAATSKGAELLGATDRGQISPGLRADLVAVEGDVFDFDTYRQRMSSVWKAGEVVARRGSLVRRSR